MSDARDQLRAQEEESEQALLSLREEGERTLLTMREEREIALISQGEEWGRRLASHVACSNAVETILLSSLREAEREREGEGEGARARLGWRGGSGEEVIRARAAALAMDGELQTLRRRVAQMEEEKASFLSFPSPPPLLPSHGMLSPSTSHPLLLTANMPSPSPLRNPQPSPSPPLTPSFNPSLHFSIP